jgi:hypothetical protein
VLNSPEVRSFSRFTQFKPFKTLKAVPVVPVVSDVRPAMAGPLKKIVTRGLYSCWSSMHGASTLLQMLEAIFQAVKNPS